MISYLIIYVIKRSGFRNGWRESSWFDAFSYIQSA